MIFNVLNVLHLQSNPIIQGWKKIHQKLLKVLTYPKISYNVIKQKKYSRVNPLADAIQHGHLENISIHFI